ncbi:uncharacterized protein LOC123516776 isoform X2 [Portunus trituberculatus]|uniref:uncharacterized protein LOC123516776 isoform X2 n=1 Tax=Portunus trituberculatus TaxID=210409 RepID=UPI001E1CC311|nr:uncharacterized protein LOC123516776 isoform X2 [Portunus trituberculatus]
MLELPLLHPLTTGSVATTLDTLEDSTTTTTTTAPPVSSDLPHMPPSPEEEDDEEEAEQEVVDLESYQPCVVDLTHEDEDDVNVVAVVPREQSIIYLGTEQRRSHRRRNVSNTAAAPAVEDLTRPDQQQHSIFESGGGGGGGGSTREEEGIVLGGERQNNWLMDPSSIDFQNPNLVFGNLFDDYPLEGGDTHIPRRLNPLREFRPSHRRQGSRSRSPQISDYSREVTRTPEIVQDVHEMQSEVEGRRSPSHHNITQVSLVHNAVQFVAQEHSQKVAQITAPLPPPSPPSREQPIVSCLVCLDSAGTIKETSRTLCSTVCGHVFCSTCLEEAVKRKKQCPVCRKKLTKKQYHPLFI